MKKTVYTLTLILLVACGKGEEAVGKKISKKEGEKASKIESNDADLEKIKKDAPGVSAPSIKQPEQNNTAIPGNTTSDPKDLKTKGNEKKEKK
ncbi:MAG: hypothetical protein FJY17_09460 [Bacteroidetes bacterium]|nr:hypothetical protein [Bacteroidota bacterium]